MPSSAPDATKHVSPASVPTATAGAATIQRELESTWELQMVSVCLQPLNGRKCGHLQTTPVTCRASQSISTIIARVCVFLSVDVPSQTRYRHSSLSGICINYGLNIQAMAAKRLLELCHKAQLACDFTNRASLACKRLIPLIQTLDCSPAHIPIFKSAASKANF
ncbi:Hypothetical predicted protein [Podarcis lilfordi]|uniref:Uncharacterized protein n=1 Tax=Podarcis lilfordi TaxID=74358 RepID=A0AA35PKE6_9SAUR|nr:Hypothetical predicted protein [Podarcis lilfordi]